MDLKCKKCGTIIKEGTNFCTFCGAPVEKEKTSKNNDYYLGVKIGALVIALALVVLAAYGINKYYPYDSGDNDSISSTISEEASNRSTETTVMNISEDEDDNTIKSTRANPLEYTCSGITFKIPEGYVYEDGIFYSQHSRFAFNHTDKDDQFWSSYNTSQSEINEMADELISELLEKAYRETAVQSNVAGEKSWYYIYSGIHDGTEYECIFEIVLNSKTQEIMLLFFLTESDNQELNDYINMVNDAEYTGAADSTLNPRSPFYVEPSEEDTTQ